MPNVAWKVVGGLAGAAAGWTARSVLQLGWKRVRDEEPPDNPASPDSRGSPANRGSPDSPATEPPGRRTCVRRC